MSKKINVDVVRFLVTFLIIANHISPFAQINGEFDFFFTRILGRIVVPLFLMITGYYVLNRSLKDRQRLKNHTKKILKIYLFCILLYLPINIYMSELKEIHVLSILKDIFINGTFYHLWYFPALILGIWITYYLLKNMDDKKVFFVVAILYCIGLLGDSYYGIVQKNEVFVTIYDGLFKIFDYTRNGLFFAPIFLYLGYCIGKNNKSNFHSPFWIFFFFLSMTFEGMLLHHYHFQRHDSMYVFLVPFMYFFFSYIMNYSEGNHKSLRTIATNIYIFHPLFLVGIRFLSGLIGMKEVLVNNNLLLYVIVSITTTIFAFIIEKVGNHYGRSRKVFQDKSLG